MKNNREHVGFIAPKEITPDQYILGAGNVPLTVLKEDGDWTSLLPNDERQNIRDIETFNCTGFGTTNAIEILLYQLTGQRFNYSDRWVGIIAGTKEPGNDPHVVAEAIRKNGLIPEEMLPFSDDILTIEDYYSFKGGNEAECRKAGQEWLKKYNFKHEWVFQMGQPVDEKINNMKVALKNSPLCLAVYAWASDERDVYISMGQPNHWTTCYDIEKFLNILDTYVPFRKLVEQDILYCKRYAISLVAEDEAKKKSIFDYIQKAIDLIKAYLPFLQKQIESLPKPPVQPVPVPTPEVPVSKYQWGTPAEARHSFRVICDEEGVSVEDKNLLCQVLNCESGFRVNTVHPNNDARKSTDFGVAETDTNRIGIAQFNDYWYKHLISPDDALHNPEKACRLFIQQFKNGHLRDWVCYSSGKYKNYKA